MMGRSHVACAAASWALVITPAAALLGHPLSPVDLVASLAVAGGAGIGPDIDHPQATIARTHGFVSKALAEGVEALAGGHRGATHWLVTAGAVGALVAAAGVVWPCWTLALAVALCGAWAARCSLPAHYDRAFWAPVGAALAGWALYAHTAGAWWVGLAVAWGWAAHPLCDAVTSDIGEGPPLLGPFSSSRIGFGLLSFGGLGENLVASGATAAALALTGWHVAGPFLPA